MAVYAGIDEAGYGPMFGPLVVGWAAVRVRDRGFWVEGRPGCGWGLLERAVCRGVVDKAGRIGVNDSKKLTHTKRGIGPLERGVLAFAGLCGFEPGDVGAWLRWAGEGAHGDAWPAWYAADEARPWDGLPCVCDVAELAIDRAMLLREAQRAGLAGVCIGAEAMDEGRFNRMVGATRSKAAVSFTLIARRLCDWWDRYGGEGVWVAVDRQSGRSHYRELLAPCFEGAEVAVLEEGEACSAYLVTAGRSASGGRRMVVSFEVDGDARHLTTALASMSAKYTRELLMRRFQRWFAEAVPEVAPTAGYGSDGKRFGAEIAPHLRRLGLTMEQVRRCQ